MLWEAGPGVCLCISLSPMKRRRARWSRCQAKCEDRATSHSWRLLDSKGERFQEGLGFITCMFFFFSFLQSIWDDKHFIWTEGEEKKKKIKAALQDPPVVCACLSVWKIVCGLFVSFFFTHVCTSVYTVRLARAPKCIYLCASVCARVCVCVSFFRKAVLKTHYVRYWMPSV